MVLDNDLGLGSFVPITEEDREVVRRAMMLRIRVAHTEQDEILAVARRRTEWDRLPAEERDRRVFDEVAVLRYPLSAPSLLDVRVVMAALRAGAL
jgi:hypothetical protein